MLKQLFIKPALLALGMAAFASHALAIELPSALVDAEWLSNHLENDDLVVLDVRSGIDNGGDRSTFEQSHIPGSLYSSYTNDGWREKRGDVAGLLPPEDKLKRLIGGLGIGNDDTVVIVPAGTGATDFGSAARIYWTFKVLGHDDVAVLNGGFNGWKEQGYEVANGSPASREMTVFDVDFRQELIATLEEVEAARNTQTQLVDARPSDYFTGETTSPAVRSAGTIPGATSLPHNSLMQNRDSAFYLDTQNLQARINEAQLNSNTQTVAFCNTGHWAATDWFVLSEVAGFDNVSMYDGSMAEWTLSDSRPVQTAKRGLARVIEFFN